MKKIKKVTMNWEGGEMSGEIALLFVLCFFMLSLVGFWMGFVNKELKRLNDRFDLLARIVSDAQQEEEGK